jgi:hypothetical protein
MRTGAVRGGFRRAFACRRHAALQPVDAKAFAVTARAMA